MLETVQLPRETKTVRLEDLYPVIQDVLAQGGQFSLTITGTSMYPTLLGGRDQVTFCKPELPLKKYDLPLYRRRNGQFVLHRIVRVCDDGTYVCCGDHQWTPEPGIRDDQIVGLAVGFCRKGKEFTNTSPRYVRWVKPWGWLLPCRRLIFRAAGLGSRLKRAVFRKRNKTN